MDLQKIYNRIIKRARHRKLDGYTEMHHIIPRCIGGTDATDNLVSLTAREHFLCHWILARLNPNNRSLQAAFTKMRQGRTGLLTSLEYEVLRKYHSERMKRWNPMHDQKTVEKVIATRKKKHETEGIPKHTYSKKELARRRAVMIGANNPLYKSGHKNPRAIPVVVTFMDGTTRNFTHLKAITEELGVPYVSVKLAKRNGTGCKRYSIKSINVEGEG